MAGIRRTSYDNVQLRSSSRRSRGRGRSQILRIAKTEELFVREEVCVVRAVDRLRDAVDLVRDWDMKRSGASPGVWIGRQMGPTWNTAAELRVVFNVVDAAQTHKTCECVCHMATGLNGFSSLIHRCTRPPSKHLRSDSEHPNPYQRRSRHPPCAQKAWTKAQLTRDSRYAAC